MDERSYPPGKVVYTVEVNARRIDAHQWGLVVDPLYWLEKLAVEGFSADDLEVYKKVASDRRYATLRSFYPLMVNAGEASDRFMPFRLVYYTYSRVSDIRLALDLEEWVKGAYAVAAKDIDLWEHDSLRQTVKALAAYLGCGMSYGHNPGLRPDFRDLWWEVVPGIDPECIERRRRDDEMRKRFLDGTYIRAGKYR